MPVKYECPKCGRRFTEWGAEKVGFKCPSDEWCSKEHPEDVELVRVGSSEEGAARSRPVLKRTPRKLVATARAKSEISEDEALVPDIEEIESDNESDDEAEVEEEEEADVVVGAAVAPVAETEDSEVEEADIEIDDDDDSDDDDIDTVEGGGFDSIAPSDDIFDDSNTSL